MSAIYPIKRFELISLFLFSFFAGPTFAATATVICDKNDSASLFAARDMIAALQEKSYGITGLQEVNALSGGSVDLRFVFARKGLANVESALASENGSAVGPLKPQGYAYRLTTSGSRTTYWVIGADTVGVMYGGLDLAHSVRIGDLSGVTNLERNPYITRRGLMYSLALDARVPNYGAAGDVFSENIEVMWDMSFWKDFLDDLARYHINVIYLWPQNAFPVLVKVPEYPLVSLSDVKRPTIPFTGWCSGAGLTPPEMLSTARTVKTMTIDDKIAFWQKVMEYGRDRGVSFSMSTFNVHLYSMEGKYGFSTDKNDPETKDYFRKAARTMALTYPLLDGIGALDGEEMSPYTNDERWAWLFDTYGRGIMDAKAVQPGRKVKFMARAMATEDVASSIAAFSSFPDTFNISTRYATNVYTTTTPHSWDFIINAVPAGRKMWLELRNESFLAFRFGDYEFMRTFFKNMPVEKVFGMLWGSNGYMYGREFISTEPENPPQLMTRKMWYHFMLLGRLSYDPDIPSSVFKKTLAYRFPLVNSTSLFDAWTAGTSVISLVNRFHFSNIGTHDYKWYPEACMNQEVNKITSFINSRTVDANALMNIATYRDRFTGGQAMGSAVTPLQTAQQLKNHADAALRGVASMSPGIGRELRLTIGDIEAMAYLGYYYAEKILGATDKAIYDQNTSTYSANKTQAINHLKLAAAHWRRYAIAFSRQYKPQWLSRIGLGEKGANYIDVKNLFVTSLEDLKLAGGTEMDASSTPAAGGTVLQAETAQIQGSAVSSRLGSQAVVFSTAANGSIEWSFDGTQAGAGTYLLEFRYSIDSGTVASTLCINDVCADTTLSFWTTGGSWQTESRYVTLGSGTNTIKVILRTKAAVFIDNVNIVRQTASTVSRGAEKAKLIGCAINHRCLAADIFLNVASDVSLCIYDIKGRILRKKEATAVRAGYSRIAMDLGKLSRGIYTVKVSQGNSDWVKKIVVDR